MSNEDNATRRRPRHTCHVPPALPHSLLSESYYYYLLTALTNEGPSCIDTWVPYIVELVSALYAACGQVAVECHGHAILTGPSSGRCASNGPLGRHSQTDGETRECTWREFFTRLSWTGRLQLSVSALGSGRPRMDVPCQHTLSSDPVIHPRRLHSLKSSTAIEPPAILG